MKKVLIIGITNLNNYGDNIISECTDYILKSISSDCEIGHAELFRRWKYERGFTKLFLFLVTGLSVVIERLFRERSYRLIDFLFRVEHERYYSRLVRCYDCVIMTSGMFKFANQRHSYMYGLLSKICEKYNKSLLYNAKSIAKSDFSDWRCRQIKAAIDSSLVTINTRDGEIGRALFAAYSSHPIEIVGDPALWVPECYGVKQDKNSTIIGVNLIRPSIYKSYGGTISEGYLLTLYCNVITLLQSKGIRIQLFCNGLHEDYEFGKIILQHLKIDESFLLPISKDASDYVNTVSQFRAIFGARLHTCITAVSMGIPVVGTVWDSKISSFAESVGLSNFFLEPSDLRAELVVERLEMAMKSSMDKSIIEDLKMATCNVVAEFINK